MVRLVACLFGAMLFLTSMAQAHTRSQSFSTWTIEDSDAQFIFAVDGRRVTQLSQIYSEEESLPDLLERHLAETMTATQNGTQCSRTILTASNENVQTMRMSGKFSCGQKISVKHPVKIVVSSFFGVSPTHMHIARIESEAGMFDFLLRESQQSFLLGANKKPNSVYGFLKAGFQHVISGLDHVVFLIALAMVATGLRSALLCISGFTLGHTMTIGLVTLGALSPNEALVEGLIGFTIALMAAEAATVAHVSRHLAFKVLAIYAVAVVIAPFGYDPGIISIGICMAIYALAMGHVPSALAGKLLPIIAVIYGLVHGAGFAGGLTELGLSPSNILVPLVSFNFGVEFAQIAILGSVYGVGALLAAKASNRKSQIHLIASLIIFGLGCFWYATRFWG